NERSDVGAPVERAVHLLVLVRVPERAVVARVHLKRRVVAPPAQIGLRSGAFQNAGFRLQCACWITWHPSGEANRGVDNAARSAVADGDIVRLIHRRACHPTVSGIRSERALLIPPY